MKLLALALTLDECAIILATLEDPSDGLAELRAMLLSEHQWRQRTASTREDSAGFRTGVHAILPRAVATPAGDE